MVTPLAPVVDRGRALVRDLRLLGAGAPVRAGLELSKRMGGHAVVFGRLARQGADPAMRRDLVWQDPLPALDAAAQSAIDPAVRHRTLREADAITRGTIELFGQRLDLGPDPDWHAAIDDPGRWPLEPWWEIDIRSAARLGDVKWVWELGRHRHLIVLARAVALEPDNTRWLDTLHHQLDSWLTANPPEVGIHWYSNLEVALRAIAWCEILALAGAALPPPTRTEMIAALHHSGRHLLADLPYTVSTMRNNHLLGDALGLVVLGTAFAEDPRAARWRRVGDRLFTQQLRRQVHPDGSQIEDAVGYHRFVLEMLLTRLRLGASGPDVRRATRTAAEHLARLGVFEGPVPRYGDGDEGRVLTSTGPFDDLVGSTTAALLVAGGEADVPRGLDASSFDEVAWYPMPPRRRGDADLAGERDTGTLAPSSSAPNAIDERERTPATPTASAAPSSAPAAPAAAPGAPSAASATPTDPTVDAPRGGAQPAVVGHPERAALTAVAVGGGIVRARMGPLAVWLKAGGDTSHGHADLCSTVVAWRPVDSGPGTDLQRSIRGDVWLVGDPGTGTYNGPAVERDHFRSTIAHSALRLGGEDELVPYRAFRWRHEPRGAAGEPLVIGDAVVLWGWHGSYQRFEPPRRVARAVVLEPDPSATPGSTEAPRVTVIDWVEGAPGIDWALSLPLGPSVSFTDGSLAVEGTGVGITLALPAAATAHRGEERPFDGWWSRAYGSREPATRLEVEGELAGPVVWQLTPGIDADRGGQAAADVVIDGAAVTLRNDLTVTVSFEDGAVRLVAPTTEAILATHSSPAP